MALKTYPFGASKYLDDDQSLRELLADALETNDAPCIAHALGVVARSVGVSELARKSGLSRDCLYEALQAEKKPEIATATSVMNALGVTITTKSAA